ncbi:hypothetical protein [Nannocystis pusilla]|uniref:hypothetical protein n=1 Tax=Nannocystis pusilla TaxID=889268 RepID=UPI003B79A75E
MTARQHGDDGVLLDDGVEHVAEALERDQDLRLGEHDIERAHGLARVLGVGDRVVEAVAQRLVVVLPERGDELAQALHGAVGDAVPTMTGKRVPHGALPRGCIAAATSLPPRIRGRW